MRIGLGASKVILGISFNLSILREIGSIKCRVLGRSVFNGLNLVQILRLLSLFDVGVGLLASADTSLVGLDLFFGRPFGECLGCFGSSGEQ